MRLGSLICVTAVALAGCPGGDGAIGERCSDHGDCASELQCHASACVPRCHRAPECGDGYACDPSGLCSAATGQPGDACHSEVDCRAGLSCQIEGTTIDEQGNLVASCVTENAGRPAGAACEKDGECRNGTCALGHCLDLCTDTRDCVAGTRCTQTPRVEAGGRMFGACLQDSGVLRWDIPIQGPAQAVLLPIPETARSVSVFFSVEDQNQKVGVTEMTAPSGARLIYSELDYYANPYVRHRPEHGQSVLAMPSTPTHLVTPTGQLQAGVYAMTVRSLRPPIAPELPPPQGTATPTMTAVVKLDATPVLQLHFHFLNFDDHPCAHAFGGRLDAQIAPNAEFFQEAYLGTLRTIFARGNVLLGAITYDDLRAHPDLDGLDADNAPALMSLGAYATGINVYFVRTLSPVGLQALGPNPGPAGLAGTRQSGVIIGLDTLCYRTWPQLARVTAHELARYMGLYNNVEIDATRTDPIADSDMSMSNLMFYSELGGVELSPGQRDILSRSAVLR